MFPVVLLSLQLALHPDLEPDKLEALHQKRVEWMKNRRVELPHGVYQDFRMAPAPNEVLPFRVQELAKAAGVQILLTEREPRLHNGVLWLQRPATLQPPTPPNLLGVATDSKSKDVKKWMGAFRRYPIEFAGLTGGAPLTTLFKLDADEVPLSPITQHVLARELIEAEVLKSVGENRLFQAEDWLCDSTGFAFWAINNQGVFEIGDRFPLQNNTRIEARVPVPGSFRLYRDTELVHESNGIGMRFDAKAAGAYRLEVDLDGPGTTKRPWIRTQPIHLLAAEVLRLPNMISQDEAVETVRNVPYVENGEAKQQLDLYLPKGKTNVPLFVFIHGGSWVSGDKSLYAPLGVMFAKRGIAMAIPSYRLMPKNPHPAQIDDVTAAFAWVVKNIGKYGVVDEKRIFLGGHSAGGHLASLLALDPSFLQRFEVNPEVIRGVAALSGVYDLRQLSVFGTPDARVKASPIEFVRKEVPPFLVSYCQWDYLGLPFQAKELSIALKKAFVPTRLLYVPGQTHITEVISMLKDGDPTTEAVIRLIETGQP